MFEEREFLGCDKTLINYLEGLSDIEREYYIFRKFYDYKDKHELHKILDTIGMRFFIGGRSASRLYNKTMEANYSNQFLEDSLLNREIYSDVIESLYCLLDKMSILSGELSFKNLLDYSILYYYLLRKGFLSKNKEYQFGEKDLMYIRGLFFADVMNGNGVCLNDSHLLKEFLNYCGFSSICLVNYHDSNSICDDDYLGLEGDVPNSIKSKIYRLFWDFKRKKFNHIYNLIKDNDKFYIFDSTNGIFSRICDFKNSSVINGKGKNRIYFYHSFDHCINQQDVKLLDCFFKTSNFESPYSDDEFRVISKYCIDIIIKNLKLIEDFYDCARCDIIAIYDETSKIRERTVR